jgi:broad specificity phosphatase PhoE
MTRLVLVRHAEPETTGLICGRTDLPLGPRGREQARRLAEELGGEPVAAVYTSPLARALDTARPIAAAHGLEPVRLDALRELDFGELDGLTFEEAERRHPDVVRAWVDAPEAVRFPGGESLADLRARVLPAAAGLRREHEEETIVVVAHGGVVRVLLGEAERLEPAELFRLDVAHASARTVTFV